MMEACCVCFVYWWWRLVLISIVKDCSTWLHRSTDVGTKNFLFSKCVQTSGGTVWIQQQSSIQMELKDLLISPMYRTAQTVVSLNSSPSLSSLRRWGKKETLEKTYAHKENRGNLGRVNSKTDPLCTDSSVFEAVTVSVMKTDTTTAVQSIKLKTPCAQQCHSHGRQLWRVNHRGPEKKNKNQYSSEPQETTDAI